MKQLYSTIFFLSLMSLSLTAEGQQGKTTELRTPITKNQATDEELIGILEQEDNLIFLVLESGEKYAINMRPANREGGPEQGGPPPRQKGRGGPGGNDRDSGQRQGPPEMEKQFEEFIGEEVVIQGKVMNSPEDGNNPEELTGVIFPQSIMINGEEIL